jgi:organic radical activating enzyme
MDEYSDDANINNIELTKKLAKKYNAIFSLQLHKIINVE